MLKTMLNTFLVPAVRLSLWSQNAVLTGLDFLKDLSEMQSSGSSLTHRQKVEIKDEIYLMITEAFDQFADELAEAEQTRKAWWKK